MVRSRRQSRSATTTPHANKPEVNDQADHDDYWSHRAAEFARQSQEESRPQNTSALGNEDGHTPVSQG